MKLRKTRSKFNQRGLGGESNRVRLEGVKQLFYFDNQLQKVSIEMESNFNSILKCCLRSFAHFSTLLTLSVFRLYLSFSWIFCLLSGSFSTFISIIALLRDLLALARGSGNKSSSVSETDKKSTHFFNVTRASTMCTTDNL
jgi:hypothetical protein